MSKELLQHHHRGAKDNFGDHFFSPSSLVNLSKDLKNLHQRVANKRRSYCYSDVQNTISFGFCENNLFHDYAEVNQLPCLPQLLVAGTARHGGGGGTRA
jgi:hypothetical protein